MKKSTPHQTPDLTLCHPYSHDFTLKDALKIARSIQTIGILPYRNPESIPLPSLEEAKKIIAKSFSVCGHVWITGQRSLELIDAAITGTPVKTSI